MNHSQAFDPSLHEPGSAAAQGRCSHHAGSDADCAGDAVVSFQAGEGRWESGCSLALEQLVESGDIEPLGQGA
ncbi:hypothetical protein [Nocardioides sp. cx-173]|uniref:hypothetical protein n=1 Tax=Nocardioides sp. cx-173 TaxID=2898796 RepID=UPI001E4948F3|nr:hypothetical protein [Nocardioides sp. cx-173]MCD4526306.1 hypothetical protein [Nocardioides sp. cx-173]UGB43482.1 hypothetical protein LQ940_08120 [Nocardioides sp. cx-173]